MLIFGSLLLTLLIGNNSFALDFVTARTASLGETGRGSALTNDTILLNPSLIGFQPAQAVAGSYQWKKDKNFYLSAVDGKNQWFQAGLSFTRRSDMDFIHLGLAKRITNWMSVGTLVKRYATRSNSLAKDGRAISGFDGGPSFSFILPKSALPVQTQLGLAVDGFMHSKSDEPNVEPRNIGLGAKVNLSEILLIYADYVQYLPQISGAYNSYHAGLELALAGTELFGRGGLMGFRDTGWTVGAGWVGPRIALNYAYQNKQVHQERQINHIASIEIFM